MPASLVKITPQKRKLIYTFIPYKPEVIDIYFVTSFRVKKKKTEDENIPELTRLVRIHLKITD